MKNLILVVISFILIVSIASAVDFPASVTKIGESGVVGGTFKLSSDSKYLYVCNGKGHFSKFDIEKALVTDTLQLKAYVDIYEQPSYAISADNKYLFYDVPNEYSFSLYDLHSKQILTTVRPYFFYNDLFRLPKSEFSFINEDSTVFISTFESKQLSPKMDPLYNGMICIYNPYTQKMIDTLVPSFGQPISGAKVSNDNKYFFFPGQTKQLIYNRKENRFITLNLPSCIYGEFDNTGENIFFQTNKEEINTYSIKDSSISNVISKIETYQKLNFLKNNVYFTGYSKDELYILIYDKSNKSLADTIFINESISEVVTAADSTSIYVLTKNGSILNVTHPYFLNNQIVNFAKDKSFCILGDSIKLFDLTPGNFDSRAWYVNGVMLNDTNKTLTYLPSTIGYYDVELVLSSNGTQYSLKKKQFLNVITKVVADFDYTITDLTDKIEVHFINKSTGDNLKYKWYFGDSFTNEHSSTFENPTHTYDESKIYSVTLVSYNQYLSDTVLKKSIIKFRNKSLSEITELTNLDVITNSHYVPISCQKFNDSLFYFNCFYHQITEYETGVRYYQIPFVRAFDKDSIALEETYKLYFNTLPANDSLILLYQPFNYSYQNGYDIAYFRNIYTDSISNKVKLSQFLNGDTAAYVLSQMKFYKEKNNNLGLYIKYENENIVNNKLYILDQSLNILNSQDLAIDPDDVFETDEYSKLYFIIKQDHQSKLYSYNSDEGLKFIFNLPLVYKIRHFDYNPRYDMFLFAYNVKYGKDSSSEFLLYKSDGTLVRKVELSQINSIRFCNQTIIAAPFAYKTIINFLNPLGYKDYGSKLITVYDYKGNFKANYYDNNIKGEILSVVPLNESRALLFGSRAAMYENTLQHEIIDDIIYYFINLKDIEVGIINDDDENNDSPVSMKAYPNPTTESVTVFFENDSSQTAQVKIINSSGNEVFETTTNLEYFMANTSSLGIGTYYIQILLNDGKTLNGKFVKVK